VFAPGFSILAKRMLHELLKVIIFDLVEDEVIHVEKCHVD
jgi:hypothetical protein